MTTPKSVLPVKTNTNTTNATNAAAANTTTATNTNEIIDQVTGLEN